MKKIKTKTITLIALLALGLVISTLQSTFISSQAVVAVGDPTFSIMQISDTQFLSLAFPQLFKDTTNWILNNAANYKLKMVIHTGDLVDNINGTSGAYSDPVQWDNANAAMSLLLNAGIPYCWDAGNHDQIPWNNASGTWLGSNYQAFNASNMRSKPYWSGDLVDSKNTAVKFTYKGYDFLIINLEYMATNATINWMKALLDNNKAANVIIAAHTYLNKGGGYGFSSAGLPGEVAWCNNFKTILDGYPNVFLTLSGHDPTGTANMSRVGNREEIFFNRQGVNNQTGAAAIRIYTFNLTSMSVNTSTYAYNLTSNNWTWLTDGYNQFNFNVSLNSNDWTLVANARLIKAYPDLREYVWQKNTTIPPNGQYDKIGLHRLVNTGTTIKGVVLMLPGTYLSGEGWTSNPPTDNFTKTEKDSQAMYWANRGFDVYALDYRTHFVPTNLNSTQLEFMANWGYDQWISDIKEAVNKVKEVSGAKKIFIAGFSFGGFASMYYSTKYWQEDLKGIILLDGGANIKTANATNSYNLTAVLKQENDTMKWALEAPNLPGSTGTPSGWLFQKQFAAQNPEAPAEYPPGTPLTPTINPANNKTWANITEYFAYRIPLAGGNTGGNNMNITVISQAQANMDRYWPDRLNLERNAINDWTNCPDVTYDFNEYYSTMSLPIISFTSELFGLSRSLGAVVNTTNPDNKQTLLPSYGHMDILCGLYSARDISEPVYQWMVNHSLHVVNISKSSDMVTPGSPTNFNVIVAGGTPPYSYQWYIETSQSTTTIGTNSSRLDFSSLTPNSYNFYCKITDLRRNNNKHLKDEPHSPFGTNTNFHTYSNTCSNAKTCASSNINPYNHAGTNCFTIYIHTYSNALHNNITI